MDSEALVLYYPHFAAVTENTMRTTTFLDPLPGVRLALAALVGWTLVATTAIMAGESTSADVNDEYQIAIFAGGCFWCVESDFDHVPGVVRTVSGYTGGALLDPTYRNHGQHLEAVQITFDPKQVSYATLIEVFWRSIDPTDGGGQFCDRGHSYQTAVFATDPEQQRIAEASKAQLDAAGILPLSIVTPIRTASRFYAAEDYHQDYYRNNPFRYKFYRVSCGRDATIRGLWGDQAHRGIESK